MSYAIIQTGGKQYKVKAGEILKIESLENVDPEKKIEFKKILAYWMSLIQMSEPTRIGMA